MMESQDRKDNRLLSSLIDLKLESVRTEPQLEEVSHISCREKERRERWEH